MLTDHFRFGRTGDFPPPPLYLTLLSKLPKISFTLKLKRHYKTLMVHPLDDHPLPYLRWPCLPVHYCHSFVPADTLQMRKSKPQNSLLLVMMTNVTDSISTISPCRDSSKCGHGRKKRTDVHKAAKANKANHVE